MPLTNLTWHHIRRTPFQSLVAMFVMFISFLLLSLFLLINDGMNSVLTYFETKPEITIFLRDGLDRNTVASIQKELMNYPSIREIKFISKEEALKIYRQENKDNPLLTEMVTSSILPASFEVSVNDPKVLEQIAQNFSAQKTVVDEIIYQKDVINSILIWTAFIRRVGITAVSLTVVFSVLITFVIIGMKITNRKDEIKICRLLGASSFYVKKPFLSEGMIFGFTGSFLAGLTVLALIFYFGKSVNIFFQPIIFIRPDPVFYFAFFCLEIFTGILIGLFTSWFGVKRYIKF